MPAPARALPCATFTPARQPAPALPPGATRTFLWELLNANGASIQGSNTGSSVTVDAGTDDFTVKLTVTDSQTIAAGTTS